MSSPGYSAKLAISPTKSSIPNDLNRAIILACQESLSDHDCFTIALSGGSLPSFLSSIPTAFSSSNIDPQFSKWHVLLADERVVSCDDDDNNMKSIQSKFLSNVPIPADQIYSIEKPYVANEGSDDLTEKVAQWYENEVIKPVLSKSGGRLDCAVLGFGPDGHTCSLFPNHALLNEREKLVVGIEDSPKPPPCRITLTFKVLNEARSAIFCGAGASKNPILKAVFGKVTKSQDGDGACDVILADPAPYPCGMVRPTQGTLTWVIDADAAEGFE